MAPYRSIAFLGTALSQPVCPFRFIAKDGIKRVELDRLHKMTIKAGGS